ncbi:MAG: ATP-binding protein [Clostridiales Family XIII bacterium]|jgi:predicted AAA+ superfamily ATPase|nr:ATP-binding protein [Clostridiales Family XIII bacterium]
MKRKITEDLLRWKSKPSGRMPLLVYGARQVGKTYIIREFGSMYYTNTAYFNLETNQTVSSYFSDNIEPERILRFLEAESRERIVPGDTLVIFDEIQSCPRALTSLKYFNEQTPEYHIIGAGSLLGVAINREKYSFPVGNVDSVTMFSLDFEEYLWALDEKTLCEEIKRAFADNDALPGALHEKSLDLYKQYLIIGGMPRAVLEFMETKSLLTVPDVQNKIINDYIADMAKYASNAQSVKIRAAYNSIPVQLAKENKKFQYKLAQRGGTTAIFGEAINWLDFAGIVMKCERLEHGLMPISVYRDLASFKLYMSDVGLLTMRSGISQQAVLSAVEIENTFLGSITENYVAQALYSKRYGLYYWTNEGTAELDFVLQKDNDIIAVEVKTGTRTKSKSLNMFVTKYEPAYSIRISAKNFGFENRIKSVPLYAVFCI